MTLKNKAIAFFATAAVFAQSAVSAFAADGDAADTAAKAPGWTGWLTIGIYLVVIGLMFYFLIFRPQKKRRKEEENLKSSLVLGVDVVTIGGICGKVVNIKDDVITVQTSIDNTLIDFKNWAIREMVKKETEE